MPHDHSWAEDMDEVRACCPDYNPLLAGTGIRCPGDPAARHEAGTTTDPKGAPMSGPCDDDDCCDDCCEGED